MINVGQKVLYNDTEYYVVDQLANAYAIIDEDHYAMYQTTGVDIQGSKMTVYNAPDGSNVIVDYAGEPVGYMDVAEENLTVLEGEITFHADTEDMVS